MSLLVSSRNSPSKNNLQASLVFGHNGIGQSRVSALLRLNVGQKLASAKYRKTEAGKAVYREQSKRWAKANRKKMNAMARLRYWANPEKFREKSLRYSRTEKGREANRRNKRKYYRANREERLAQKALDFSEISGWTLRPLDARMSYSTATGKAAVR